jgi:hypothetical protein
VELRAQSHAQGALKARSNGRAVYESSNIETGIDVAWIEMDRVRRPEDSPLIRLCWCVGQCEAGVHTIEKKIVTT